MRHLAFVGLVLAASATCGSFLASSSEARAQSSAWGLSESDWALLNSPDIRARIGLPGSINRVMAAAEAGDGRAMAILSSAYATGTGVARNPSEAFRWGAAGAATGDAFALHVQALNHLFGTGTHVNQAEFIRLIERSSDGGRVLASAMAGDSFLAGKNGATVDPFRALTHYARAADGGLRDAQYVAGLLEYSEVGQDPERGLRWLKAASDQGHVKAGLAVRAIELQHRMGPPSERLFVAGFGGSAVAAHSVSILVHEPCQSALLVERGAATGRYLIDWTRSRPMRNGQYGVAIRGAVQSEATGEVADQLTLTLHTNQQGDEKKEDDLSDLIALGNQLNQVCTQFGTGA